MLNFKKLVLFSLSTALLSSQVIAAESPEIIEITPSPVPEASAPATPVKVESKSVPSASPSPEAEKEQKRIKPKAEVKKAVTTPVLYAGKYVSKKYKVQPNDSFVKIAHANGLNYLNIMQINNRTNSLLRVGEELLLYSRIVPTVENSFSGIIVNIPENTLYHFKNGELLKFYPVAVGLPTWQTPVGNFKLVYKAEAPDWHVPVSIQKEMKEQGKEVVKVVKAGPDNPLGNWWMGLSAPNIGIHSTNAPLSVGYSVTHGCIRMKPDSAKELFSKIEKGTAVHLLYQPVKAGFDEENRLFVEVYKDIYNKKPDYYKLTANVLSSLKDKPLKTSSLEKALREKKGVAVQVN